MQPSEPYFKSKRNMIAFASALLLILFSGIEIEPGTYTIFGFPVRFSDTSFVDLLVAVIVIYYLIQISLFWSAQNAEIRSLLQFKIDFYLSFGIGCVAIGSIVVVKYSDVIRTSLSLEFKQTSWSEILGGAIAAISIGFSIQNISKILISRSIRRKERIEEDLSFVLPEKRWRLIFNPNAKHGTGFKEISFKSDGNIGEGKNNNEHSWRVRGEFLEILNNESRVFSRFKYDKHKGQFFHTNDEDTLSLRSQRIEPLDEKIDGQAE